MSSFFASVGALWIVIAVVALLKGDHVAGCRIMTIGVLFVIASDVRELLVITKQLFSFLRSAERKDD